MRYEEIARMRKSARGYLKKPVPRAVVEEIIDVARWAPSSYNTQPWHVHALAGAVLDEIRERNMEAMLAGSEDRREVKRGQPIDGVHRQRQIDVAKQLFGVMGIERHDKEGRADWVKRGFRQFDAPVSLVLTFDKALEPGIGAAFDLGALSYGIVLAAWERGLGTVINSQGIMRSDIVREVAKIPDDEVIFVTIAMGYPDDSFAANAVRSTRLEVDEVARFVGFED